MPFHELTVHQSCPVTRLLQPFPLSVLPDFLCKEAMDNHNILKIWDGYIPVENTLYFGKRKQSLFMKEIELIEKMLVDEFQ